MAPSPPRFSACWVGGLRGGARLFLRESKGGGGGRGERGGAASHPTPVGARGGAPSMPFCLELALVSFAAAASLSSDRLPPPLAPLEPEGKPLLGSGPLWGSLQPGLLSFLRQVGHVGGGGGGFCCSCPSWRVNMEAPLGNLRTKQNKARPPSSVHVARCAERPSRGRGEDPPPVSQRGVKDPGLDTPLPCFSAHTHTHACGRAPDS